MTTPPTPSTPLTDNTIRNLCEAHDGDLAADFNSLGNFARSLEIKCAELEQGIQLNAAHEQCVRDKLTTAQQTIKDLTIERDQWIFNANELQKQVNSWEPERAKDKQTIKRLEEAAQYAYDMIKFLSNRICVLAAERLYKALTSNPTTKGE